MAGRKRKPAALHRLKGTYRADRHGTGAQLPPGRPTEPESLPVTTRSIWRELAAQLEQLGTLQPVHGRALTVTAQALDEYRRLDLQIAQDGGESYQANGLRRLHPLVPARANAWMRAIRGLTELGLTPASQGKVAPAGAEDADDPANKYIGG